MRSVIVGLLLGALGWAVVPEARAWHNAGHMTIARIAYLELSDKQKTEVARILKAHPHYRRFLAADRPAELAENEWAFLRAAVWADWVRPDWPRFMKEKARPDGEEVAFKYHRGPWHYINLPIVLPEDPPVAVPKNLPPPEYDEQGEPGHVLTALKKAMTLLRAADMSDECKAISLCWLLHLAGDLHQPLHASTLVSKQYPQGDMGGNLFLVSVKEGAPAVNLHFFWDAQLFSPAANYKDVEAKSEELRRAADFQRGKLTELQSESFKAWADESYKLARKVAYRGGKLKGARAANKEQVKNIQAPVLPDDYAAAAAQVSARRMVLAGYRIADKFNVVFPR
jgi:hypothetical protein